MYIMLESDLERFGKLRYLTLNKKSTPTLRVPLYTTYIIMFLYCFICIFYLICVFFESVLFYFVHFVLDNVFTQFVLAYFVSNILREF